MAGKTDRRAKAVSGMLTISRESEKWWKKPLNRQRNGRHVTLVISGNDNDDMQLTNCCCQSLATMHVSHCLPFTPRRRQFPVCLLDFQLCRSPSAQTCLQSRTDLHGSVSCQKCWKYSPTNSEQVPNDCHIYLSIFFFTPMRLSSSGLTMGLDKYCP